MLREQVEVHDRQLHAWLKASLGQLVEQYEARAEVFEFIEVFYNRQRLHQTLGYVSPEQFETNNPVPLLTCPRNQG